MRNSLFIAMLPVLALSGCQSFTNLEEACHDKVPNEGALANQAEIDAFWRLNCHRRLVGLQRARPNKQIEETARSHLAYIKANPRRDLLLGKARDWLLESPSGAGYTGIDIFNRVDEKGYLFPAIQNWGVFEYIYIEADPFIAESSTENVDNLMRDGDFRQLALQGSWGDGAYAQIDLTQQWFIDSDWATFSSEPPPENARLHYFIVFFDLPHFELVDRPRTYPVEGQTNVPLYSFGDDYGTENGLPVPVQLGYPITLFAGTVNVDKVRESDQNLYGLMVENASLVSGPDNIDIYTIHPGDFQNDRFSDGMFLRSMTQTYTYEPLQPNTPYTFYADVVTNDGPWDITLNFTTGSEDGAIYGEWDGRIAYPGDVVVPVTVTEGTEGTEGTETGSGTTAPAPLPSGSSAFSKTGFTMPRVIRATTPFAERQSPQKISFELPVELIKP